MVCGNVTVCPVLLVEVCLVFWYGLVAVVSYAISLGRVYQFDWNGRIVCGDAVLYKSKHTENGNEGQPHLTALSPKPQLTPETSLFAGRMAFEDLRMQIEPI